jgi:hypothetical protein
LALALSAAPAVARQALTLDTIGKLSPREAAGQALGQMADKVTLSEPWGGGVPGGTPQLSAMTFYDDPAPVDAGLCGVNAIMVEFAPETPFKPGGPVVVDPPSRAGRVIAETRFRVVADLVQPPNGWDNAYRQALAAACAGAGDGRVSFFTAESSSMLAWAGAEALDQALRGAAASGAPAFKFICEAADRACGDARERLKAIRLDQITAVRDCLSRAEQATGDYCYDVEVRNIDPLANTRWSVRLRGKHALASVSVTSWMLPIS